MSNRLEQFINDHREEFDTDEPSPKSWDNIKQRIEPAKKQQGTVIRMNWMKWSAAAAVVVVIGGGALYLNHKNTNAVQPEVAKTEKKPVIGNDLPKAEPTTITPGTKETAQQQAVKPKEQDTPADNTEADLNETMYHFAKLVEIKHRELGKIKKDEPLLYQQFAGDVNKLDSVYHSLEKQLPQNPNREQLIEAMIQNLQLQMDLLNHQLTIIKQINQSKKSAYEKAFKST